MKKIDARGKPCPQPVLVAKKALKTGEPFLILADGSGQAENIQRAVNRAGAQSTISNHDSYDSVEVIPAKSASGNRSNSNSGKLVVSVPQDSFGSGGDRELEDVLCRAYFHTLTELDEGLPHTILFYDRGVFLTVHDSPILEDLRFLEQKGVTLLACGTCLKHFNLLEKHAVGSVSNMYETAYELGTAERFYSI